jgi:uncharacterized protein (DUF362 family)
MTAVRAALASLLLSGAAGGQEVRPGSATVFSIQADGALTNLEENEPLSHRMVDELVMALTQKESLAAAWRSLILPSDTVGIKVATDGGRYFSSHPAVVEAIVDGLESAGVARSRIVIWDRSSSALRLAGFQSRAGGPEVHGIDPPRGLDPKAAVTTPALGKLMWGDLLFAEKQRVKLGAPRSETDQLSSTSHLGRVFSRITKIINVPVLSDERGCGIAGAIYNLTVPNVDNWRRFTQPGSGGSIADLYADERISPKVVLHVMDALLAQYAGGPGFNPNYAFAHQTLYASRDPVALDATALRKIAEWRKSAQLPPNGARGEWLQYASQLGLGESAEERISVRSVALPR